MRDLLVLNIGNTHTCWAYRRASGILENPGGCDTSAWLEDWSHLPDADGPVWAACVVPEARKQLEALHRYPELHWADARAAGRCGLGLRRMDIATLGMDRIANAAALLSGPLPAATLDCGTAITLEMVDEDREFCGGAIAPGRALLREALARGTAALPHLAWNGEIPDELGRNTRDAMMLGVDRGAVGTVRELLEIARRHGAKRIVLCGGDAPFFARAFPELEQGGSLFTLEGIAKIGAAHSRG